MKFFWEIIFVVSILLESVPGSLAVQPPVLVSEKAVAAPVPDHAAPLAPPVSRLQTPASQTPATASPVVQISGQKSGQNSETADNYPLIGRLEMVTFGQAKPADTIENRLANLEQAVFRQQYKDESLFDRTQRLKLAIHGDHDPGMIEDQNLIDSASLPPLLGSPVNQYLGHQASGELTYFETLAHNANNRIAVTVESLPEFALEQVNYARTQIGVAPLSLDKLAAQMAEVQVQDLSKRKVVSHTNQNGANPDLRYTLLGGSGAVNESLAVLKEDQLDGNNYTRALVANLLKLFIDRQDDRDALLSPDATGFGFAMRLLPGEKKAVACVEVSTSHGVIAPIVLPLKVGDKIEVKGDIEAPYKFFRVSLAWEGASTGLPATNDETDEALPYFPPLDYISYAHRSEHDYSTAMTALRMGALVGVIAGSMFMPPVALAVPLIAIAPGPSEAKPMSDIPLHGGVKISGNSFSGKIAVSNGGKPGIYYLTVWAISSQSTKPVPISRRAFMVGDGNNVNSSPIANAKTPS